MRAIDLLTEVWRVAPTPPIGVPDSLLKEYLDAVTERTGHLPLVAPNEGAAVAYAIGQFLGTGSPAVVYLQNSGLGNALNPLLSLAHQDVYGIPMILVVGWRGAPGTRDEPQHRAQGATTHEAIASTGCATLEITADMDSTHLRTFLADNTPLRGPTFLLVRPDALTSPSNHSRGVTPVEADGIDADVAIRGLLERIDSQTVIIATTGYTARRVEALYQREYPAIRRPFLSIGGMGHASAIALGLASTSTASSQSRRVMCIDGDGAALMHLGTLAWIAQMAPRGFVHVIMVNRCHESVGAQPTASPNLNFAAIARAVGCSNVVTVDHLNELQPALDLALSSDDHVTLVIRTHPEASSAPPRPESSPRQMLDEFLSSSGLTIDY